MNAAIATPPPRIVFLDRSGFPPDIVLRPLSFAHEFEVFASTAPDEVAMRIVGADIVITNKVPVPAAAIAQAPHLSRVAIAATGYDMVDVAACKARGITVSNIRNYAVHSVPEHTFALILALRRSIAAYRQSVADGAWQRSGQFCYFDYPIRDLAGSTLGIIGDGTLGRAVADLGRAFGMTPLYSSYKGVAGMGPLYTPFDDVLRRSDVITLHCPLTPATRNMIAAPEFALMERRPLLINTARGGLVDEGALADALRGGQVAGAAFDVVTVEPPPADHPLMALLDLPNFILTPHVAWASHESIQGLADQLMENIELFRRGTPRHLVTS
ncbi:MAG: D-2-hydroxyacid dehydrogenase [Burkholderiales bacterium]|nr:D-2-hydroxyacid dehydrogenase [Burkholderiales bacterium]